MLRSTNKKVIEKIHSHIADCVYDVDTNEELTPIGASKMLYENFVIWCNSRLKPIAKNGENFTEYLRILPFAFEFSYYEIKKIVADWLEETEEEMEKYSDEKAESYYHALIFREMSKLKDKGEK